MTSADNTTKDICPACGGSRADVRVHVDNANFTSSIASFDVVRCLDCQLCRMRPWPDAAELRKLYEEASVFSVNRPVNPNQAGPGFAESIYRRFGSDDTFIVKSCLAALGSVDKPRVLDIGCAGGRLLSRFRSLRADAALDGIDIDPGARDVAPDWLKDRIRIGSFPDETFNEKYDIVTMKFVIEHLRDPDRYIQKALEVLRPGGVLFISTPDIDSAKAQALQTGWSSLNDPKMKTGHILWFNATSLRSFVERAGFKSLRCVNRGESREYACWFSH